MIQKITKIAGFSALAGLSFLSEAQTMNWAPAGPIYTAGRARNMIVDKLDPSGKTMYVGSTSSGVFKTTDAGVNWGPLDDQGTIRNISYMAQAPDGTIYAATGEGFLRAGQKSKAQAGTGLYKLSAGGALTLLVPSSQIGTVINRVAISPLQSTHIALTTNKGVFVSTDGTNFNPAVGIPIPSVTPFSGQDVKFDSNGILYCSLGSEWGTSTVTASKIYKAVDASFSSFLPITPTSSVLADMNYGRIEMGISPSDPKVIYASCANKNPDGSANAAASLKALYVSYDAGINWALIMQGSPQLDPLSNGGTRASGDYAQVLLVNPTNPHQLFYGSYSFHIFTRTIGAAGDSPTTPIGTWTRLGNPFAFNTQFYLHENIHDIKLVGSNPTMVYVVTDAGIYRSIDMAAISQNFPPSFQPFYKGLITGQFNSVSIERTPIGANATSTVSGSRVDPFSGFIGGTGGNGMTYYSGTYQQVTKEINYLFADVYNSEYSRILPDAAFASTGDGNLYRSSNVKTSNPVLLNLNKYTGALSKVAPTPEPFDLTDVTTGTPFKLWEWYGQTAANPDSMYFYNDTLRFQASMETVAELTSRTNFTFSTIRPSQYAIIDSIMVRTGTVSIPVTGYANLTIPFTTGQDISLKPTNNVITPTLVTFIVGTGSNSTTVTHTLTIYSGSNIATTGPVSTSTASAPSVTLNATTFADNISVTFSAPPFATKTFTSDKVNHASYYRVFATVYYKYKAGDVVHVVDNNISTKTNTYTTTLAKSSNWKYGTLPVYTITTSINPAIQNPTYVLFPANTPSSSPSFTVRPSNPVRGTYTISTFGTYTINAPLVTFTLTAVTSTAMSSSNPTFVLVPGNVTQTVGTFTVAPQTLTDYTITATGSGSLAPPPEITTFSNCETVAFSINTGTATQSSPIFTVSPTVTTTYTLTGVSSNTVLGKNASSTFNGIVGNAVITVGPGVVPLGPNNRPTKMPMQLSARLAMIMKNGSNTANIDAIVVSKSPLALNDPMSVVRVSQTGCQTDDVNGNPSANTIVVNGKPILLEWSKNGTEIYYATDANKLYRVSHINEIMDLSPSSYSGKFYTDVFRYQDPIGTASVNPITPYRTTLVGSFEKPITSISVSKDDKNVLVTLNNPTATASGTTGIVMYSKSADIRKTVNPVSDWERKDVGLTNAVTYCSLMEKSDSKKVFVGTDNGIFYTSDVTAGNWTKVNNGQLPNVQIFDIKQQVLEPWDCFNSGQIYVATNGRGVWTNNEYYKPHYVGVREYENWNSKETTNSLSLYPNPTNGLTNLAFKGLEGETVTIKVLDISGRCVITENLGAVTGGDVVYSFETNTLNSGVYIVNVSGTSGVKRVGKLIVTK